MGRMLRIRCNPRSVQVGASSTGAVRVGPGRADRRRLRGRSLRVAVARPRRQQQRAARPLAAGRATVDAVARSL